MDRGSGNTDDIAERGFQLVAIFIRYDVSLEQVYADGVSLDSNSHLYCCSGMRKLRQAPPQRASVPLSRRTRWRMLPFIRWQQ